MIRRKKHSFLLLVMACAVTTTLKAQPKLEDYIREGIASNESIKQQAFALEKSVYALKEAKSMFLPDVTFSTTYTRADGGRTIDFPTGDLFNGVYATLNRLTASNNFPQLQNQQILLNPDNFYDARFRTTLPLLNAELIYNKKIKQEQVELQRAEMLLYKRELVKDIKTAYYNYLKANSAVRIYESSLKLVEEGQRVNKKLFENSKVNRTSVLRSENEVSRIGASLTDARKNAESARYYFNFLLNRPLTDSIQSDDISALPSMSLLTATDINGREELSKLKLSGEINRNLTGLAKSYMVPKVGTFLDLGSQAFDWRFNSQSRYYLWGVSLEWNLFSSGRHTNRIRQTIADKEAIAAQTDYITLQLMTELKVKQNNLQSAIARYSAAQSQQKTSQTYYSDMSKLYKEGMAIYIELLDAQNQWIDAQLNTNMALFDAWIAYAAIERANASFNIQ